MAVKSSGFAVGNLRARENTLLKRSDMTQLAGLSSTDTLASFLQDHGFGERGFPASVPELLKQETERLWNYLYDVAPDPKIFDPFLLENDFHNLKVLLKALVKGVDGSENLLFPVTVDPKTVRTALEEKRYDLLPEWMRAATVRAFEVLVSTGDAQLCDGVLDAACMTAQTQLVHARDYRCDLARELIEETVLSNMLKATLRCAKAGKDTAFLSETLVDTTAFSKQQLKTAALSGVDGVLELMEKRGGSLALAAERFQQSPSEFERYCDNRLMAVARKAKRITMGVEPLIGYYMARMAEIRNIRILYSGIKTGQPLEVLTERLRELYG